VILLLAIVLLMVDQHHGLGLAPTFEEHDTILIERFADQTSMSTQKVKRLFESSHCLRLQNLMKPVEELGFVDGLVA
jgi:hypothetical protein